jgi:hypothetical protein
MLSRAKRIGSENADFEKEILFISNILQSNGFPRTFIYSCIRKFNTRYTNAPPQSQSAEKKNAFIFLPFIGPDSAKFKRQLCRLIEHVSPVSKFICVFNTQKLSFFVSKLKSKTPILQSSNVVYKIKCTECPSFYVGLTTRRLNQRIHEHKTSDSSALYRHSETTGHTLDYENAEVLARDNKSFNLHIKETLFIIEQKAYLSLNRSMTSTQLHIWP